MDSWRTIEVPQNNDEIGRGVEQLQQPYKYAMVEEIRQDWEGLKEYFRTHPQQLNLPMTVDGDTAFHVAASCCKTKCKQVQVLEFLLHLKSTHEDRCIALRRRNNKGHNTLHQVSVSGNVEAAKFLVSHFNKLPAEAIINSTDVESSALPLLEAQNHLGETPVYMAAAHGHTGLVKFYVRKLEEEGINEDNLKKHFRRKDQTSILHIAVLGRHFETALWLQTNYEYLAHEKQDEGLTSLQLLAHMPTAFEPTFEIISKWKMLIYNSLCDGVVIDGVAPNQKDDVESSSNCNQPRQSMCWNIAVKLISSSVRGLLPNGKEIWDEKRKITLLKKNLIPMLVKQDYSWGTTKKATDVAISLGTNDGNYKFSPLLIATIKSDKLTPIISPQTISLGCSAKLTKSDEPTPKPVHKVYNHTPLLIATITGICCIVDEILKQHPQAAEHANDNGQNLMHLAIKNRQKKILTTIKSNETLMSRLYWRIDTDRNTILHHAADRSYYSIAKSLKLMGPAFQLQEELRWMVDVLVLAPDHYTMHRNKNNQTAEELFNSEHNELLKDAQIWIKSTAQSCSTVAVLVADLVFAAAYTQPRGKAPNFHAVFLNSRLFWLFTPLDVLAISCSLSSVAFFLSVLSSPLEYPYFLSSLPRKLIAGFVLLSLSMAATIFSFAVTIFLLIHVEKKWTKSLLFSLAIVPFPLFGVIQFPILRYFKSIYHKIFPQEEIKPW